LIDTYVVDDVNISVVEEEVVTILIRTSDDIEDR
jgi:hypothetical protein